MSNSAPDTVVASTSSEARVAIPAPASASAATAPRRPTSAWRRRLPALGRRVAVGLALLLLWQVASWAGWIDSSTLASPVEVWDKFRELSSQGVLWPSILTSLRRVLIGLAIGVSIGTVLGLIAGLSKIGEELVDAPVQMLRTLPFLGLLPLLIVWLGIGEGVKVGLVVIGVIFPIYLNLHKGIRGVDPRFAELSRACGVGRVQMIRKVILPGALPSFLVGLRFALGVAWLSLVIAETVNADKGVGYLIMQGQQYLQTDVIVMGLVIYALLGLIMEAIVRVIELRALRWRREFTA
jgi:sulfonate transport system permease protein